MERKNNTKTSYDEFCIYAKLHKNMSQVQTCKDLNISKRTFCNWNKKMNYINELDKQKIFARVYLTTISLCTTKSKQIFADILNTSIPTIRYHEKNNKYLQDGLKCLYLLGYTKERLQATTHIQDLNYIIKNITPFIQNDNSDKLQRMIKDINAVVPFLKDGISFLNALIQLTRPMDLHVITREQIIFIQQHLK